MSELNFLRNKWKNKYDIDWCHLCDTAIIICPKCKNSSCNGGGCEECMKDWPEFRAIKRTVQDYLTLEEKAAYEKGERLKRLILDSIERGEPEIPWKAENYRQHLSANNEEIFQNLLK